MVVGFGSIEDDDVYFKEKSLFLSFWKHKKIPLRFFENNYT